MNMITKILKLKNFGIFHDFSWEINLPEFKKFNLIYGWNRSGKTTISRIFTSCEKKILYDKEKFKQYPEDGIFEISSTDGKKIKSADVSSNFLHIKVFNKDFIDDNLSFESSNTCKPIIYVSEEDIESKRQLEQFKKDKITLSKNYMDAKKNKAIKENSKNIFLTGLGREIANVLFDKSYNKIKAENRINSIGVDNFVDEILSDDNKKKYEEISKSKAKEEVPLFKKPEIKILVFNNFRSIFEYIKGLLEKKVLSETLERLKNDEELNNWVKQGFDLHKTKGEFKKCLFCQKTLDSNLFDSLSRHFSKDYQELLDSIDFFIQSSKSIKLEKISTVKTELYPDLRVEFKTQSEKVNEIIDKLNHWLFIHAVGLLEEKHKNPFDTDLSEMLKEPAEFNLVLNNEIDKLNQIISNHNNKVKNHALEVKNAKEKLELHSIGEALSSLDYKKFEIEIRHAEKEEEQCRKAILKNNTDISELEKKTSNIGKAVKQINKHLKEFFGKEEIILELDDDKKGYIIKRNKQLARNLSEGEKTAIAFSYFIVKAEEKEFKIKDGIIFIDDPICSFDANFIYHAFSLIQNHFKEAGQLFISTHNFQLFNLIKDWFIGNNQKRKRKGKNECCEFYMVENYFDSDIRKAKIVELDKTLKNFKSEYHFLFSLLNKFKDIDLNYADFYTIGNVARRFFDIFADFKIPDSRDQKQKMEAIVKELNESGEIISTVDIGKAYKLVNEFSHNSDPTSTIEHKDKSESKEAIRILLKIVEKSEPKHFEILKKNAE
ncbi:MAG: AAA family ATPase [Parachlamydiales bacterium]|nr:AAA family ATPase [Parachlamydiales bacterium]